MTLFASKWIDFFSYDTPERRKYLDDIYGKAGETRPKLIIQVLQKFIEVFGDKPVFITRCPGRINLRGMHVDTHGGFLNLMTIEQEVVLVGHIREDDNFFIHNLEPEHKPLNTSFNSLQNKFPLESSWSNICHHAHNCSDISVHWHKYITGVLLRTTHQTHKPISLGLEAVVGGDIPEGSALSSSHALCLSLLQAIMYTNQLDFDTTTKLKMVQDAEWFTGARSGLSDQTAELLGKKDTLLGVQLHPGTAQILEEKYLPFPGDLSIIIADSRTRRDISSTHAASYNKNRFAYSVALQILKEIMKTQGFSPEQIDSFQTLDDFSPERLGGTSELYKLFRSIPHTLTVDALFHQFNIPGIQEIFERYYSHLPEEEYPREVPIRGPLVFGICETIRARHFFEALQKGDISMAGYLMILGHNGDRVIDSTGRPFHRDINDDTLFVYENLQIAPYSLTGDFGASTPILDRLVDIANQNGALGSCLTGAGLGGVIISFCLNSDVPTIKKALQDWLSSDEYSQLVNRRQPLTSDELEASVFVHNSTQGASIVPAPFLSFTH
ncbi:MAG TPA: galactokinase family protein [Candidatus Hydrogenedens sp.]|nr:galactokinase family protein [Candidatus Hydrogenedens sp.]